MKPSGPTKAKPSLSSRFDNATDSGERVGTSASPAVLGLAARAGERAEVDLHLRLRPGLTAEQVSAVVQLVTQGLGGSQLVAERMVRGEHTPESAAAEIDRRADRLLEKRRWMMEQGRAA